MDIGLIVTLVSYVLLAIIVGLAFLIGFKRGVKRSLIHFATNLVFVVVSFFITPPISNAILGIKMNIDGSAKPLSQIIIDKISSNEAISTAIENSPTLKSFLEALPSVVLSVAVFLVLYGFMRLLGYIVYKIIEKTTLKNKKEEKELGLKRNKWAGGGIGAIKGLVFTFIAFAPLTALIGFVSDVQNETKSEYTSNSSTEASIAMSEREGDDSLPSLDELFDSIPPFVLSGINAYNNNVFGVVGGAFGFDNFVFDNLTKITVDGESIKFRQEALEYIKVYNTVVDVKNALDNSVDTTVFKNINWDAIDKTFDKIINSGLVKGLVSNLAADFVKNYDKINSIDVSEYENILSALKTSIEKTDVKTYFVSDFNNVYYAISAAGRSGLLDEIYQNKENFDDILNNVLTEENKESITAVLDKILNLNIIKDATAPVAELAFEKMEIEDLTLSENATNNWKKFKTDVLTIVEDAVSLNSSVSLKDTIDDPLSLMNIDSTKIDNVLKNTGNLLDRIENILTASDKGAVEKLLEKAEVSNLLSVKNEDGSKNTQITNYESLLTYLSPAFKNARDLDIYDEVKDGIEIKTLLSSIAEKLAADSNIEEYSRKLENIILPLYRVDGLREKILEKLTETENEFVDFSKLNVKDEEGNLKFDESYLNWQNDLSNLTAIIVEFYNTKVGTGENQKNLVEAIIVDEEDFSETLKAIDTQKLNKILMPVLYSLSTRKILQDALNEAAKTLDDVLEPISPTTLSLSNISLKKGDNEDQAAEICKVITTIIDLFASEGAQNMENLDYEEVGKLLDALKENACRIPLSTQENKKTELGLFTNVFDALYNKMLGLYPYAEEIIGDKPVYEINFTKLLKVVKDFKDAETNADSFINKLSNIVIETEGQEITKETIKNLVNSIDTETIEQELESIDNLLDVIAELEIDVIPDDAAAVIEDNKEEILYTIENNNSIPEEMKEKIKDLLGLLQNNQETQQNAEE